MNAQLLNQIRYDLAQEVLAMGKQAPVDLEAVLDHEADRGLPFAREAAAILAFDGESAGEYAHRVQTWLLGLVEKHVTDEHCKAYADACERDAAIDRAADEQREEFLSEREAA